jgi:hypothetical protein
MLHYACGKRVWDKPVLRYGALDYSLFWKLGWQSNPNDFYSQARDRVSPKETLHKSAKAELMR